MTVEANSPMMEIYTLHTVWTSKPAAQAEQGSWVKWENASKEELAQALQRSSRSLRDNLETFSSITVSEAAAFALIR